MSLGRRLYEAMSEPFAFTGKWNPKKKPLTCEQYEQAAQNFAKMLGLTVAEARMRIAEAEQVSSTEGGR